MIQDTMHWTEDDFTQWVYGLKDDAAHLRECTQCEQRSRQIAERRAQASAPPEVSWEFLAAQRRGIYHRLDRPLRNWAPVRWGASLAMLATAAVMTFTLWQNPSQTPAPLASAADDKLFTELVSIDQSNEPRALKPIHSLFEQ